MPGDQQWSAEDPTDLMGPDAPARRDAGPGSELALVLFHRDGVRVASLGAGRELVVGRAWPADVIIPDRNLSRQHAIFGRDDRGLWVRDLESTNGTQVNGDDVTEARVGPHDVIVLGPVTVSVHAAADGRELLGGVESHERFMARLAEEVARASDFGRTLSVSMVRALATEGAHVSRWLARVKACIRRVDRIGLYGPDAVLVLMPELDHAGAVEVATRIVAEEPGSVPLCAGVAVFPSTAGSVDELVDVARGASRHATSTERVRAATPHGEPEAPRDGVVVLSRAMRELYAMIDKVAPSALPVLILGETGTGKELVARAVHERSPRREGPLRYLNCGAIPATLLESALFGHVRGAFTGADRASTGVFEDADGGTVVLDELGELSLAAQAALLRVLETKRIVRVGSTEERAVDVRIVAATHRDLDAMCEAGTFRSDLLFRINGATLPVPPLRERPDEIEPLARHFLAEANRASPSSPRAFDDSVLSVLRHYEWPGNVRELRNVVERAAVVSGSDRIGVEDLPERVRRPRPAGESVRPAAADEPDQDFKSRVRRFETELILDALLRTNGNQVEAAQLLRIPVRTLTYKLKSHGIKKKLDFG